MNTILKTNESETGGIAQSLNWHQLIIYASFTMPITVIGIPLTIYLPPLYGGLGIDLALMGFILLVARFSDLVTDPVIGITSDKSITRIGHRKPWLLGGAIPLIAMAYLLLVPPDEVTVVYFALCVVLTYFVMTTMQIPYISWGAELSGNYNERSRITTTREAFVNVGYLGLFLTMGIAQTFFGKDLRDQLFLSQSRFVVPPRC